jgi:high affinity Mn2+ porin
VALQKWLWFTGDFQRIVNPGFNQDRGPVDVFSIRVHGEF